MPVSPPIAADASPALAPASPRSPWGRVGAYAAYAVVGLLVFQVCLFLAWPPPGFGPTPANTRDWFALFETAPLVALAQLDGLMVVDFVLLVVMFVALWGVLRRERPVATTIALVLAAISAATYLASNPALTLMSLADGYRAAAPVDQLLYVAAGQATLATYHGTPFDAGYVLSAIAGLVMTSAILRTRVFSRTTGYLGLAMYVMNLVPPTAGTVGVALSLLSLPLLALWLILVGRRLWTT